MKKIYMHEKDIPKTCNDCFACSVIDDEIYCNVLECNLQKDYNHYFRFLDEKRYDCPISVITIKEQEE